MDKTPSRHVSAAVHIKETTTDDQQLTRLRKITVISG